MNYQRIYNQIVERGKIRQLDGYKECHHIVPKCMGGSDNKENLVELTAREHFLCHYLLVRIYPNNQKLIHAFWLMCIVKRDYQSRYIPSSRQYEEAKNLRNSLLKGRIVSQETRDKLSKATTNSWTEERKLKHIERNRTRIFTESHLENISRGLKDRYEKRKS